MTFKVFCDNLSASALLSAIFEWFDKTDHLYCVQRNYQGYPDKLTGDVDLVVAHDQAASIADELRNIAKKLGWACYIKHAWNNTAHLGFYKPVYPNRFVLVIDLFAGCGWHGIIYLSASDVLYHRIRYGITWCPLPAHQAIITLIHHLLYNGFVPSKYRQEIISLVSEDTESFSQFLSQSFGDKLTKLVLNSIFDGDWEILSRKVSYFKISLVLRASKTPIVLAKTLLKGYDSFCNIPEGVVLLVVDDDFRRRKKLCNALLDTANRWHLFLPPLRKIVNYNMILFSKNIPNEVRLALRIIRRGGVAILGCNMASDIDLTLSIPTYKIIYAKNKCNVNVTNMSIIEASDHFEISEDKDINCVVQQVWNFILKDRAQNNLSRFDYDKG
jgi:hypothetical protein